METMHLPSHIAVIPDGNRRWARRRSLLPWKGHEKGIASFTEIADAVFGRGIPYLTLWAASEDNLTKRAKREIAYLLSYLEQWIDHEIARGDFARRGIQVKFIGRWRTILSDRKKLAARIDALTAQTAHGEAHHLTVLFGYDGQREMLDAIRTLQKRPEVPARDAELRAALATGALPPVDLVIRTGGEPHWSAGFMMWQTANSQFAFTETLWPAFGEAELLEILKDFSKRERRFGG